MSVEHQDLHVVAGFVGLVRTDQNTVWPVEWGTRVVVLHLVALLRSYLQHGLDSQLPRRRLVVGTSMGGGAMLLTHVLVVVAVTVGVVVAVVMEARVDGCRKRMGVLVATSSGCAPRSLRLLHLLQMLKMLMVVLNGRRDIGQMLRRRALPNLHAGRGHDNKVHRIGRRVGSCRYLYRDAHLLEAGSGLERSARRCSLTRVGSGGRRPVCGLRRRLRRSSPCKVEVEANCVGGRRRNQHDDGHQERPREALAPHAAAGCMDRHGLETKQQS